MCSFAAPPNPSPTNHLYVCHTARLSFTMSVCHVTSPSVIPPAPTVCLSTVSPANCPSDRLSLSNHLYTILPHPSGCPTLSDRTSIIYTSSSNRPSLPNHLYNIQPSLSDYLPPSRHTNQSDHMSITSQLSDRHYDLSACMSVIPHDSPYTRFNSIPSSCEWGAITHDSLYTRFKPIPSSHE